MLCAVGITFPTISFIEGAAGLFGNLKEIFLKSKDEVARGAQLGKVRIDVFQLRKDREHFMQRLGEEAYELLQREDWLPATGSD